MATGTEYNEYVSYPMYKGLQKPLEFMGIQGRTSHGQLALLAVPFLAS